MIFAILNFCFCALQRLFLEKYKLGHKLHTLNFLWIFLWGLLTKKQTNFSGFFFSINFTVNIFVWVQRFLFGGNQKYLWKRLYLKKLTLSDRAMFHFGLFRNCWCDTYFLNHKSFNDYLLLLPYYHLDSKLNGACKMVFAKSIVSTLWLELRIICCSRSS